MLLPHLRTRLDALATATRDSGNFQGLAARQQQRTPFTKAQAYYVKHSVTAAACSSCPWFLPTTTSCVLVSPDGAPDPSRIAPSGICGLYAAGPARIAAYALAYGRGPAARGVLPQAVRRRVEAWRLGLDEPSP